MAVTPSTDAITLGNTGAGEGMFALVDSELDKLEASVAVQAPDLEAELQLSRMRDQLLALEELRIKNPEMASEIDGIIASQAANVSALQSALATGSPQQVRAAMSGIAMDQTRGVQFLRAHQSEAKEDAQQATVEAELAAARADAFNSSGWQYGYDGWQAAQEVRHAEFMKALDTPGLLAALEGKASEETLTMLREEFAKALKTNPDNPIAGLAQSEKAKDAMDAMGEGEGMDPQTQKNLQDTVKWEWRYQPLSAAYMAALKHNEALATEVNNTLKEKGLISAEDRELLEKEGLMENGKFTHKKLDPEEMKAIHQKAKDNKELTPHEKALLVQEKVNEAINEVVQKRGGWQKVLEDTLNGPEGDRILEELKKDKFYNENDPLSKEELIKRLHELRGAFGDTRHVEAFRQRAAAARESGDEAKAARWDARADAYTTLNQEGLAIAAKFYDVNPDLKGLDAVKWTLGTTLGGLSLAPQEAGRVITPESQVPPKTPEQSPAPVSEPQGPTQEATGTAIKPMVVASKQDNTPALKTTEAESPGFPPEGSDKLRKNVSTALAAAGIGEVTWKAAEAGANGTLPPAPTQIAAARPAQKGGPGAGMPA